MSRERVYPERSADPFAQPPLSFTDREGRGIEVRASAPGAEVPEALFEMYAAFDPAGRAQGIPPVENDATRRWLESIYAEGLNAVAWHGDVAAGHATLVPEGRGKAVTAGAEPRENAGDEPRENADGVDVAADPGTHGPYELAIFVLQPYQEAGIGTRLLEGLLGYAQSVGLDRVWLTVERWNHPAISLYEKVGFEVTGTGSFDREMGIRL